MLEMIQAELAKEDDVPEWQKEVLENRAREVAEGKVKWLNFDEMAERHGAVVAQRLADYRSGKVQAVNFDELVSEWRKTDHS